MATECTPTAKPQRLYAVASSGCPSICNKPWKRRGAGMTPVLRGVLMKPIIVFIVFRLKKILLAMS